RIFVRLVGDVGYFLAQGKARDELHPAERKCAALEHFETLLEIYGTGHGLRHARKHLAAYAERAGAPDGDRLRQGLVSLTCPIAVKSVLSQLFDSSPVLEAA
ncbi:MAG: tRNA-dihydrouridine synthase, partial [Beijerinckiaceae bacterium]|nr:tRNA-dihydrouridine synthase [Beijerinckiaceae bacterium]